MKYVICNGDKKLKFTILFSSLEECVEYLRKQFAFVALFGQKINSFHVSNCFILSGLHDKSSNWENYLIYGLNEENKF